MRIDIDIRKSGLDSAVEHRPPPSSPGRRAPDRLGAAQPEVLLLIGVATAWTLVR